MSEENKVSALPVVNTAAAGDRLLILANGVASTISTNNLFGNSSVKLRAANLALSDFRTPANSTITVGQGQLFYDNNYIYVAIANNVLMRAALETF